MGTKYKRVGKVEQKIHSAKLPYNAWKVFFLIDGEVEANQIAEYLEEDASTVEDSLQRLIQEGLVDISGAEETDIETEQEQEVVVEEETEDVQPEEEQEEIMVEEKSEIEELSESEPEEETLEFNLEEDINEPSGESEIQEEEESAEDLLSIVEEESEQEEEKASEDETITDFSLDDLDLEDAPETETETESKAEESVEQEDTLEIDLPDVEEKTEEEFEGTDLDIDFATEEVEEKEEKVEEEQEAQPEESEPEKPAAEVSADTKTILVVDDSIVIRKMVEIALEDENYQIETAVSGKDGLAIMDDKNPHLMILDLMLPDINGIDLLKTVKASKGIPVIMLSGKDSPQMVEKARSEGADAFLPKPFKDDELVAKIRELLS
ncbi:MAG: response regulator [Calditrichaceae bacterium]